MLTYALLVSTSFPVGSFAIQWVDPVVVTLLRFSLATVLFGILLARSDQLRMVGARDLLRYATVSATIVIFFVLMFESLRYTDPVSTGALFTVSPLLTAGTSWVLLRKRTRPSELAFLLLGAAGAVWVVFDGQLSVLLSLSLDHGEWIFLLATLSYATYVPLIKRLHRGEPALVMTFWTLATGTLLLAVLGAPRWATVSWSAPPEAYGFIAYLAIFPTAITFAIAQYAGTRIAPTRVMAYTYLTPSFVVLIEALRGQGWPSWSMSIGVLITCSVTLGLQRAASATPTPRP